MYGKTSEKCLKIEQYKTLYKLFLKKPKNIKIHMYKYYIFFTMGVIEFFNRQAIFLFSGYLFFTIV